MTEAMAEKLENIHATVLVLEDRGILLMGPSGSGKTTLALTLIERAQWSGRTAILVADDQTLLQAREKQLIASVPPTIAGGVEIRGAGLFKVPYRAEARVDLCVELVRPDQASRYPSAEPASHSRHFCGVNVPLLSLPDLRSGRESLNCARAIEATLFMTGWSD